MHDRGAGIAHSPAMTYHHIHPAPNASQLIRRPRFTRLITLSDRLLSRFGQALTIWQERDRQRRALARLDDRLLRDIGVSRTAALRESQKPFWRE